jgi:Na+/phosphate symporter
MIPPAVTPDLQQNIVNTIYLLFAHNYIAFAYFIGVLIGVFLAFFRPSKYSTLILLGFAILLFSYEYDKHIIDPLRVQTINSFITATPHYKVERIINLFISEVLPILLYVTGWVFLFIAMISRGLIIKKKK